MKHNSEYFRKTALMRDNYRISSMSIRSNLLRTVLTVLIIAFGIMALIGILTTIDSLKRSVNSSFSAMGANSFSIRSRGYNVHIGGHRERTKNFSQISYSEASRFKKEFDFPSSVSVSIGATGNATIKYESEKTNPNVSVRGVDENYLVTAGYEIAKGRNFTEADIRSGENIVLVGAEVAKSLFKSGQDPLEKTITVSNGKYRIIGLLKEKGATMVGSGDRLCCIPVTNVRQYFSYPNMSFTITVLPNEGVSMDQAMGEAESLFRVIRGLDPIDASDFHTVRSDSIAEMMMSSISSITVAATLIGIITLLGAAIGLMNIMLVAVAERTQEIGIRKAIGASNKTIQQQFLFEAVLIGQIGGVVGIVFGIIVGNLIPLIAGGVFTIPWGWIIMGFTLCFIVGIVSGIYPAMKASRLDPIESLRFE
ncbi:MAG: ABC transporter permease [Bacteroidales bacterium]|nr:ABC transporter permease [Bacteroidales bacterium]